MSLLYVFTVTQENIYAHCNMIPFFLFYQVLFAKTIWRSSEKSRITQYFFMWRAVRTEPVIHLENRRNYSSKQETNSKSRQRSQTGHTHSNPLKMSWVHYAFKNHELCVSPFRSPTVHLPRQKNHRRRHKHSPPSHSSPSWQKDTHVRAIPLHWLHFSV